MAAREVAVDDRGRCNLAKVRTRKFSRYFVAEDEDGTLTLTPAVTLTPAEMAALGGADEFLADPHRSGTRRERPGGKPPADEQETRS